MTKTISKSELIIMKVLWDHSPLAASDISDKVSDHTDWNIRTVKTLLSRLVTKKALATHKDGRRFLYSPLISRDTYASKAARGFTDRLFGGRAAPLVAYLAENGGLSDDDISELEALIAELKK